MSSAAILLVLGSALLHATWNARANAGDNRTVELGIAYANGAVLLLPWLIIDPPTEALGFMVMSGLAHGGYILFLSQAYQRGGLATMYPIARGTAPLIVAGVGIWLLDQTPSGVTFAGAVLVALGLAVIGGVAWKTDERSAIAMALMTGAFIASYTLLDARGVEATSELGYFSGASFVSVLFVAAIVRPSAAQIRSSLPNGLMIGLFSTSAYALVLLAYTRADAANVATLRATSILFGLLLVRRTVTPRLVVGAIAVVAGAILVTT